MKIQMRKISSTPKDFCLALDHAKLEGQIYRINSQILCLEGKLLGEIELICDRTGESFIQTLDNPLVLYISDGIWDTQSQSQKIDSFDVIEFFDGFVDLNYILESEIESIKSDYHTKTP
ncbi:hypothetical protein LS68_006045 [Helicobacter sp. MIT 05-5293]|uniref:hypothetical protein n=1 Tax=Helicobacter sp. MIT 05-5293 TaxID=1548149 RepID=UPI00051CC8DD|nr:hypothetical protein [Helicobacter sp. MIT 05-5293]TLD81096.1 hypothetical protein LS68_006045 [Helicobacter sp. MIT 05-5293]